MGSHIVDFAMTTGGGWGGFPAWIVWVAIASILIVTAYSLTMRLRRGQK